MFYLLHNIRNILFYHYVVGNYHSDCIIFFPSVILGLNLYLKYQKTIQIFSPTNKLYIYKIISTVLWTVEILSIIALCKINNCDINKETLDLIFMGFGILAEVIFIILIKRIRQLAKLGKIARSVHEGAQVISAEANRTNAINLNTTIVQATEINNVQAYSCKDIKPTKVIPENTNMKIIDFTKSFNEKTLA